MEVRLRNIIVLVSFILVITPYTIGINSLPIFGFGLEESPMYIMLFLKVDDSKERNDNFSSFIYFKSSYCVIILLLSKTFKPNALNH